MTIQDIKLLLDIDFSSQRVIECKIIQTKNGDLMVPIKTDNKVMGNCKTCSSSFQIFLYGKSTDTSIQETFIEKPEIIDCGIVKLEEELEIYPDNKIFVDVPVVSETNEYDESDIFQCPYCPKKLQRAQALSTHVTFCKKNPQKGRSKKFIAAKKGTKCKKGMSFKSEDTKDELFVCQYCKRTFRTSAGLKCHENFCMIQNEKKSATDQLKKDVKETKIQHEKEDVVENDTKDTKKLCKEESDTDSTKTIRRKRIFLDPKYSGPNPHCFHCDKKLSSWMSVRRHEQLVHERNINYTCEICGFGAIAKKTMDLHKITAHSNDPKPYVCDLCTRKNRFSSKSGIFYHMRLRHLNIGVYMCDICSKNYISKGQLETHIASVHQNLRPYSCPDCDKRFKHENDVKTHRYKIHISNDQKPQFRCNNCDFVTHVKPSLERHKLLHLGDDEKPYHCTICNKGFPTLNNQMRHEKTHLDIRPFSCTFCNKAFRTKDDLRVHVRHHTGEKPYECEICGQKYSDRGCYRSHLIGHEKQLGITLDKSVKKFLEKPKIIDSL